MNRGLYTAATGLAAGQTWLETVAHNLANASTVGYKQDGINFEEGLLRELRANGGRGRVIGDIQSGPQTVLRNTDFRRGSISATGNGLDVAIGTDRGMFAVQSPSGVLYTRAGNFVLNEQRQIVDTNGHLLLDEQGSPLVAEEQGQVSIDGQGQVLVGATLIGKVGVWDAQYQKIGSNLFQALTQPEAIANPALVPGALESSNVNVVQVMVEMVNVQRSFELAQRSVTTHDETMAQLIRSAQNA